MGKKRGRGKRFARRNRNSRNQKQRHSHFIKRARKHYGLDTGERDIRRIIELIESGKAGLVEIQIAMWKVLFCDKELPVVYDHREKRLITCLPQEALERALKRRKKRNNK